MAYTGSSTPPATVQIALPSGWYTDSSGNLYVNGTPQFDADNNFVKYIDGTAPTLQQASEYANALLAYALLAYSEQVPTATSTPTDFGSQNTAANNFQNANWTKVLENGTPESSILASSAATIFPKVKLTMPSFQNAPSNLDATKTFALSLSKQNQSLPLQQTQIATPISQPKSGSSQSILNGAYSYLNPYANNYNPNDPLSLITSGAASLGQSALGIASSVNPQNLLIPEFIWALWICAAVCHKSPFGFCN